MSIYSPYERLVTIKVLGRPIQVPENNTVLRGVQYVCPDSITYGKFCWNNECGNCELSYSTPGSEERRGRGCQLQATEGLEITRISFYLDMVLGPLLETGSTSGTVEPPPGAPTLRLPPGGRFGV